LRQMDKFTATIRRERPGCSVCLHIAGRRAVRNARKTLLKKCGNTRIRVLAAAIP